MRRLSHREPVLATLVACVAAAGCGKAPATAAKKAERLVYASLGDCIETARFDAAECDRIIQTALADHDRSAPSYRNEAACEKAEGTGWCDRAQSDKFVPRPAAFLVTIGANTRAQPLYRGLNNAKVLRTLSGPTMQPDGDAKFTDRARSRFDELFDRRTRRG